MVAIRGSVSDELEINVSVDDIWEALNNDERKELALIIIANSTNNDILDAILEDYCDEAYVINFYDITKEDIP